MVGILYSQSRTYKTDGSDAPVANDPSLVEIRRISLKQVIQVNLYDPRHLSGNQNIVRVNQEDVAR